MSVVINSDGKIMTAYSYGKKILSWNRGAMQILNPHSLKPISYGTMIDFVNLVEISQRGERPR